MAISPNRSSSKGNLTWTECAEGHPATPRCCAALPNPFQATGGLNVLKGNIGTAVIKSSSIPADRHVVEAPAKVFHSQEELQAAFKAGELNGNVIAVVRFQGPKANGMPELHSPHATAQPCCRIAVSIVALVTDGRMSGASRQGARRHSRDAGSS